MGNSERRWIVGDFRLAISREGLHIEALDYRAEALHLNLWRKQDREPHRAPSVLWNLVNLRAGDLVVGLEGTSEGVHGIKGLRGRRDALVEAWDRVDPLSSAG